MKTILIFSVSLILSFSVMAQIENVGIGTLLPDNSAVLDITAQDKGGLLPRMDSTHYKNIVSPKDESFVTRIYSDVNGTSSTAISYRAISDVHGSMAIGKFNEGELFLILIATVFTYTDSKMYPPEIVMRNK